MSAEDKPPTLADQAAAWVPPWARAAEPGAAADDPSAPQPDARPGDAAAEVAEVAEGPAEAVEQPAGAEPAAVDEPEPEAEPGRAAAGDDTSPVAVPEAAACETEPAAPDPVTAEPAAPAAVTAEPGAPEDTTPEALRGALEAILLVVDEPVPEVVLAQVLEQPTERVTGMLGEMAAEYTEQGRGFELRRAAGGWRLYTRADYAAYVERFVLDGQQVRLTQAALETLAVVAYKQPVTRSRISAIRGVNCDGVVRTLVARGLVEDCGTEPETGAFLYRTTPLFLEKLGLDRIDQLPPLAPFLPDDVDEVANAQG
jgi:segregation and condensation protein B